MNRLLLGSTLACLLALAVAIRWPQSTLQPQPTQPQSVAELVHSLVIESEDSSTSLVPVPVVPQQTTVASDGLTNRFALRGTVLGENPLALIEDRPRHHLGTYRVGNHLLGATLVSISRGVVWFAQGNRRVPLWFIEGEETTPPQETKSLTLKTMTLTPAVDAHERMTGLKLKTLSTDSPLLRLGLRPDDVIVSINGQRLTSPQKTLAVLRRALLQAAVTLHINRAGSLHELRLQR